MTEVVTIGETMAAFIPERPGYLRYVGNYSMKIAGAESNTAVGICKLGHTVSWISALGEDEFGEFIQNSLRAEGVDTSNVVFRQHLRTGVMFKQMKTGAETSVYYYRENSAAGNMGEEILKEDFIKNAQILHLTGITPTLSKSCEKMVKKAVKIAHDNHVMFSFDPNIRKKLWKENSKEVLKELTLQAEIVLIGLDEAEELLGTASEDKILKILFECGKAKYAAIKKGKDGAIVASPKEKFTIPPKKCRCIDPVGAGDAFNAAFLCGILEKKDLKLCGEMGAIAGALATETYGDIEGYPSKKEMELMMQGKAEVYR